MKSAAAATDPGGVTSGPEIASGAIAGGSTEVITHTTILARLRPARLMARALLLREPTRKRLYCARAKQSAPISNPLRMAQDTGSRLSS
ncbi:hypothetical protein ALC56_00541 [Trachymyrmex septentrionalis]|uniref:Uncharacterized protein n=1 Tax=Trachymyrmex septentrionalis TaxID=34720 RepID=A0A195FXN1_9HYME|nr:hypothetical protein ALC56_00541 [Trachymyrmex septentrionalis]